MSHSLKLRERGRPPVTPDGQRMHKTTPPRPERKQVVSEEAPAASVHKSDAIRIFERTVPVRCIGLTLLSTVVGCLLLCACLSALRPRAADILASHFFSDASLPTAWLSLVAARLPVLVLLAVAGMTRFSGGLCSVLLAYRGLCDGAALAAVITFAKGDAAIGARLTVAFVLWMLTHATLRVLVAISSRRLAAFCTTVADTSLTAGVRDTERAALRYRIWQHAAVSLGAICASIVACLVYCIIIF